ncbi:MAG: 50S ribosomal protein L27 [Candidatus Peribacteraceae bacterium]|jgi:large subunit ribosomal protein L27|nr:50S ribosomal protein L27 [Candidatus Peribacteraceae bacterium]MDP7477369.1 50S ribosomal protein L27 [Candidatus Peribacteraceae bacterium]
MAHKKAGGSTSNVRDSNPKYRGVKRFGGQTVRAGEVLIRQKGFQYRPGDNTHVGKDWTIHADCDGKVKFTQKRLLKFNGKQEKETFVHVEPQLAAKS